MPSLVLLGDSIRLGYQPTVIAELSGWDVWCPEGNGRHTVETLGNLHAWVLGRRPDFVHVNAGLHDLKTVLCGRRENLVPLDYYRLNVRTILQLIRQRTSARVIWATTTPVQDKLAQAAHAAAGDFDRYNADVVAYNAAACQVCGELGVPVNDLYALAAPLLAKIQTGDGVHFTPEGSALLGKAVARAIRAAIV